MNFFSHLESIFSQVGNIILKPLPYIVRYLIGYCHFYYQLGYGLVFYIYIYRRRMYKKKQLKSFYGNSVPNWILFNVSVFNKLFSSKGFWLFLKNQVSITITIIEFLILLFARRNHTLNRHHKNILFIYKKYARFSWTPVFKRTSYISVLNLLKRFRQKK